MPIVFRCEHCECRYRVPDQRVGQHGICRNCGQLLQVPDFFGRSPTVVDAAGSAVDTVPLVTHLADHRLCQSAQHIVEHARDHLGPADLLFSDRLTHPVSVDVLRIPATPNRPYQTLLTCGMSDWSMPVPPRHQWSAERHSELMVCLPADWPLDERTVNSRRFSWPLRLLQSLGRLPFERRTWLGPGHTVPNGHPQRPYDAEANFSCAMLTPPSQVDEAFEHLTIGAEQRVRFYGVVALYSEETRFKLRFGADSLLSRFDRQAVTELIDPSRPSVCRRRRRIRIG